MRGILAITVKDLRLILRDKEALFWILMFPLMMAVLFGSIFTGMGEQSRRPIKVALVDEDRSDASKEFVSRLKKQDSVEVVSHSFAAARDAVRKGKLVAYVRIRKGYGASKGFMAGDAQKIEVGIDPSKRTERGFLQGILMKATFGGLQDRLKNPKQTQTSIRASITALNVTAKPGSEDAKLATFLQAFDSYLDSMDSKALQGQMKMDGPKIEPVKYAGGKRPRTSFEISFPQSVVWGLLGIVASFAVLIARERVIGTLLRLRISPLSWFQILAGKGLAAFVACIVTIAVVFAVGIVAFGLRLGNFGQLAMAIGATSCCVTGLMMLIATIGKTEQAVGGAAWAVMMPLAMFGGGMLPLIIMPDWMLTVSKFSPIRWSVYAFEGAIWRGLTMAEMVFPCVVLVLTGAVTFVAGVLILSRTRS
jgi:ABC-2 type transport system permease protein